MCCVAIGSSSVSATPVDMVEVPTAWTVTYSFSNSSFAGSTSIMYSSALNNVGRKCLATGGLITGDKTTADEQRLMFNTIFAAKIMQSKLIVSYENTTCTIISVAVGS